MKHRVSLDFTEWMAIGITLLLMGCLVAFPVYTDGFSDLYDGIEVEMPYITRLLTTPWFAPLTAIVPGVIIFVGFMPRPHRAEFLRKVLFSSALIIALAMLMTFVHLIQQPLLYIVEALERVG